MIWNGIRESKWWQNVHHSCFNVSLLCLILLSALRRCLKSHLQCWSSMGRRMKWLISLMVWPCLSAARRPWSHCGWKEPVTTTSSSTASTWNACAGSSARKWLRSKRTHQDMQIFQAWTLYCAHVHKWSTCTESKQTEFSSGGFVLSINCSLFRSISLELSFLLRRHLDFTLKRSECVSVGLRNDLRTSEALAHSWFGLWIFCFFVTMTNDMSFEQS